MAQPGEYALQVLNGEMAGHVFPFVGDAAAIGRNAANDVCLPLDPLISRWHAQVSITPEGVIIEDRNSGNGTWVGTTRIYTRTQLVPGSQIRIGRTWLQLNSTPDEAMGLDDMSQQIVWVDEDESAAEYDAAEDSIVYAVGTEERTVPAEADREELRRRLHAFELVSTALGWSLDLQTVLVTLVDTVMQVMSTDRGSLWLIDAQTGELDPRVVRQPQAADGEAIQISRHIVNRALDERVAILTSDAMHDTRFQDVESVVGFHIRSAVCVPICRGDRALGVLYLDTTTRSSVIPEADLEMLTGLANQAAVSIENARLYTDLRAAYDELQSTQEQLLRTERLSTIGALSASIAHDMGNVVTPLVPLVRLLLRNADPDAELAEITERQLARMSALITRLRSFSRPTTVEKERVDANRVLEETVRLLQTEANHRSVDLVRDMADSLPEVVGDASELDRVFLNIILNAIQAAPEREGKVIVRSEVDEGDVVVSVIDNGPGIPADVLPHLFEPLFTTKEGGTGLGLFSSKRIVEDEHGGSIEVDTHPDGGTTLSVRLPIAGEAPKTAPPTGFDEDG